MVGPVVPGASVSFRVSLDGRAPEGADGADLHDGLGVVDRHDTLQLIRQPGAIEDRVCEIEFLDGDVEVYCFTFG